MDGFARPFKVKNGFRLNFFSAEEPLFKKYISGFGYYVQLGLGSPSVHTQLSIPVLGSSAPVKERIRVELRTAFEVYYWSEEGKDPDIQITGARELHMI